MIISASRRTDIPAFYSDWFLNRARAGYCLVHNPFNMEQVSRASLQPWDVDAIVFWTKNAEPLSQHLNEIDSMGYRYYFQYTLNPYGPELEPNLPSLQSRIYTFQNVSRHVGPDRIIWRYDPIIVSNHTSLSFHKDQFAKLAKALQGYTHRVIISLVDYYPKLQNRFATLQRTGWVIQQKA